MNHLICSGLALLAFAASVGADILPFSQRVWKSADGKALTATLVKADATEITLRLPTGKDVNLRVEQLSAEDLAFLDQQRKELAGKIAAAKATKNPSPPAKPGAKPDASAGLITLDSTTASRVYRLGVPVPGKGGGCIGKTTGRIINISTVPGKDYATIIVELEGGIRLSAASYESVWGGAKMNLQVLNGEIHKLPSNDPPKAAPPPKADPKKEDPKKKTAGGKDKAKEKPTALPAKSATQRQRLFGKGDTVSLSGTLHFTSDTVGTKPGFYARGYSKLSKVQPAAEASKPK